MAVETEILPARYRSPARIALGGMGEIYRATDSTLGRAVAVKLLAERYARDESVRRRFTREALAAARLSGEPHVVMIFDVGEYAGRPFIVMEHLSGGSLEERIRKDGAQEPAQALDWLEQAAMALDAAHRHGVVHRDVKPANLLLDRNGDVHVNDQVPSIAEICEGLPPEVDPVFRRAMAKDPSARFGTAAEFVAALRAALAEAAGSTRSMRPVAPPPAPVSVLSPVRRRRRASRRWAPLVALLALGAVGGAIAAILLTNTDKTARATAPAKERTVTITRQGSTVQTTVTAPSSSAPSSSASSLSGSQLNDAGYRRLQAGDHAGGPPLLHQAGAELSGVGDPTQAYANYNLGYTLLQLGQCTAAIPYLERARKLEPQRAEPRDALKAAHKCGGGGGGKARGGGDNQ